MGRPEVTVRIRNIAVGGAGVGEVIAQSGPDKDLLGITAFVPFTSIGEKVTARISEQKDRYIKTELLNVEEASPSRVAPPCKYFRNCGGCELQHIAYEPQLKAKYEMAAGALRAAKLSSSVIDKLRPVAPSEPYHYRRRITLHVDQAGKIGFYRQNSRSVVPIEFCHISVAAIAEKLKEIQAFGKAAAGKVSSIQLEDDAQGVVAVLQSPYDLSPVQIKEVLGAARDYFQNVSLMIAGKEAGGFGRQILELPLNEKKTLSLQIPAGYFSQVNWRVNMHLISRAVEQCQAAYNSGLYDLYAGAGNFSLPLARAGLLVTAVETDKRLVLFGRENAKRHNLDRRIEFVDKSVESFLSSRKHEGIELVIADPPRSGLGSLVSQFSFARRFLFVSCHLPSFVRDIKAFADQGWEVEAIEPFDMFSQTSYLEILGTLRKA